MFTFDLKSLNPFGSLGSHELVGIDVSENDLKIAYVRHPSAKREVSNLFTRNIEGMSDSAVSKIIAVSLNDMKVKNPIVIVTLSSHLVITKNIEIPSTDPREIREIINLQAGRHTPYSREEIIVDYIDIGTYKHSYTKILLVLVSRTVIKRQLEILDKAGLKPEKVFFSPEALAWCAGKMLRFKTDDAPVSLIHIDTTSTDFTVVFHDKLAFVRSIPIGAQHLVSEKDMYEVRFAEEVRKSLEAYQGENVEKNPASIIVTGAIDEGKGLEMILGGALNMPVRMAPYFKNLAVSGEALRTASAMKRLSFLNVIAPLLAHDELKVNLIPEEVKLRKALEERGKDLIKTGIFVLAIFVLICMTLISKIYFKGTYLKNLTAKYGNLNQEAQKLEKSFTEVNLIRKYIANRGYSLEVLAELYVVAPIDLELNNIRYEEQNKFTVGGTAKSMSTVFAFVDSLEKSGYFKDVKTKYTSKRKEGTTDVTDFEIVSALEKPVE